MLKVKHIELKEANSFISEYHRHHKPVIGHRFSICAINEDKIVGVCIVGRPVARGCDYREVLEVTRLCTDGTKNACSILYAQAARAGKELGYSKIQSYILETESGISIESAGWKYEYTTAGGEWKHSAGPRRTDQPLCKKKLYSRILNG